MEWYLYIAGIALVWVWSSNTLQNKSGDPELFKSFIFALFWPVLVPSVFVGGLVMGIIEVISEERERNSSSRSDKGD